jgi:uncharacterized membrane protein
MSDMALGAPMLDDRRAPRGMLILLVASLALNLLFVGSLGAMMWRSRTPTWHHNVAPNLLGYATTLPTERRKELWERSAEDLQHIRPFRREVRAARQETIKALAAEPFDRQQFIDAQARQTEAENRARDAVKRLYLTIAEGMTPAERRGFSHWRERTRPSNYNPLDEHDQRSEEQSKR